MEKEPALESATLDKVELNLDSVPVDASDLCLCEPEINGYINIDKIKRQLIDPDTISQGHDPDGRAEFEMAINEANSNAPGIREELNSIKEQIEQNKKTYNDSFPAEYEKEEELDARRNSSGIVRLKNRLGIIDKKIVDLEKAVEDIKTGRSKLREEAIALTREIERLGKTPGPDQIRAEYNERMFQQPLSNEEKRDFLKQDVLSELSEQEYINLWKRLNPYFLSHITRQGFRDHNAMIYHSVGMREFHDGFMGVLKDKKLIRPPLALDGLVNREEVSVKRWMEHKTILEQKDEESARKKLDSVLNDTIAAAPKYPDKSAVHFAGQLVSNDYYGGENGNETFFLFPADIIASQNNYCIGWQDFSRPCGEVKWNDIFVWPESMDNPGISTDAGMAFLPADSQVDRETGSRYASKIEVIDGQEKRVMVEDSVLVKAFIDWGMKDKLQIYENITKINEGVASHDSVGGILSKDLLFLGFNADDANLLSKQFLKYSCYKSDEDFINEDWLKDIIERSGMDKKRAENTISSKEYWELFFDKNPSLRPKHLHYYEGDPTKAVFEFQQENGIGMPRLPDHSDGLLGFEDHSIIDKQEDQRANIGYEELLETAGKIITGHYNKSLQI